MREPKKAVGRRNVAKFLLGMSLACAADLSAAVPLEWNQYAEWFMYAPSFAFKEVKGAANYRFSVLDDYHVTRTFTAAAPTNSLETIWAEIPPGFVSVSCRALDAQGNVVGLAGERTFWKNAMFKKGAYPKARRSYAEAVRMGYEYLLDRKANVYFLKHGKPDPSYDLNCYPAKMHSATIQAMCGYLKLGYPRKDEAMKLARLSADYLISISEPEGSPLAGWPHTYEGTNHAAKNGAGKQMLIYPASAGSAFLALYKATKDAKYLEAAKKVAERYLQLQGEDGTWSLVLREKDGTAAGRNRLMPNGVIDFFETLYEVTNDVRYRAAADRAFAFIDNGPLKTWNWEGQFEDVAPSKPYRNLTKHNACDTAIYLLKRFPQDSHRLEQAKAILRFAEDQFVIWERPMRKDGIGYRSRPDPARRHSAYYRDWYCPSVMEQYSFYVPIDASAAKLIRTYLAYFRATGDRLALAKARALGDSAVNNQQDDGRSPTGWFCKPDHYQFWINCHIATIVALQQLAGE